jgi:perosamine synthetase
MHPALAPIDPVMTIALEQPGVDLASAPQPAGRRIPVSEPSITPLEMEYAAEALRSGWISSAGKHLDSFERRWAAYCGRRHGVAVCNGTAALELALSVLNLPPGAEVILPSFTIVSSLEAVLRNGLEPVLVDCDPRTYCMDPGQVRDRITPRTAAVMPVHIYGHPVNMEALLDVAGPHNLSIVEDAAEAHGAECFARGRWRRCGSFGQVSAFSFYANKNITTGEGGMVLTDSDVLAARLRSRRNLCFGADERFRHEGRGWNYRMTNVAAALGCAQLDRIDQLLHRKLAMAHAYSQGLRGLPLQLPHVEPWARTSVWMYAVTLDDSVPFDAGGFARRLSAEGVETRPFFLGMHEQPAYPELSASGPFPVTGRIARRGLYLPSGQAIGNDDVARVIAAVRKVLR